MDDIKLFCISDDHARELTGRTAPLEKMLQRKVEQHMEMLLGVRFVAREFPHGATNKHRMDTVGLDENNCPVIIEYKRSLHQGVVMQSLAYLTWLLDHKAEFKAAVQKTLGNEAADSIHWTPRVLCIAGNFSNWDRLAMEHISANIELISYRFYGDEHLLLTGVGVPLGSAGQRIPNVAPTTPDSQKRFYDGLTEYLQQVRPDQLRLWESINAYIMSLGADVQPNQLKYYKRFKRNRNFAALYIHPKLEPISVMVKPVSDEPPVDDDFASIVTQSGHWAFGDLRLSILSEADLERAKPLILRSYEAN